MLWDGVLRRLEADMPSFALEAWIRPLDVRLEADRLTLLCPTAFHRDRVRDQLLESVTKAAAAEAGRVISVELVVCPPAPGARRRPPAQTPRADAERRRRTARAPGPERADREPVQFELPYSFDNFIVGPCNALAREASIAVARGRQQLTPLFLWSAEHGRGKTHLARAIVAEARRAGTQGVIYASAETFTNEFMASIRDKQMDRFKRRYRQGCGLLVVEDVQFFDAKKATQLEIFHTIGHLLDAGSRVVLTGDRLPREIDRMDPRLRTQMSAGLVAELETPDARVRREILRRKAAAGGVHLPEDCLEMLVDTLRGNLRDLEGVLIQLVASASLLKRPIDAELTRAALHKISPERPEERRLGVGAVIDTVATLLPHPAGGAGRSLASSRRTRSAAARHVPVPPLHERHPRPRWAGPSAGTIPSVRNADRGASSAAILERAPLRYQVEELAHVSPRQALRWSRWRTHGRWEPSIGRGLRLVATRFGSQ